MSLPTTLLEDITTKNDLQDTLSTIDSFSADLYRQKKTTSIPPAISALAQSQQVDLNNRMQAETFFQNLKKELSQLPHLGLTLSFQPSRQAQIAISRYVHANVSPYLILDFTVDESLLGGATLSYNGFYKDFTLGKLLKDAYANHREIFTHPLPQK